MFPPVKPRYIFKSHRMACFKVREKRKDPQQRNHPEVTDLWQVLFLVSIKMTRERSDKLDTHRVHVSTDVCTCILVDVM